MWPGICFTYNCVCVGDCVCVCMCVCQSVGVSTSVLVSGTVDLSAGIYNLAVIVKHITDNNEYVLQNKLHK